MMPTTTKVLQPKKLHLILDPGFLRNYVISLLSIVSATALLCHLIPTIRYVAIDIYFEINEYMMITAHQYAWWSLLGLLSSSCCALQLLLNALSFGCAGFNTVLGPIRPITLAVTTLIQTTSWYIAFSRPHQWKATSISTILVTLLTFLPEILVWFQTQTSSGSSSSSAAAAMAIAQQQNTKRILLEKGTTAQKHNHLCKFRLDNVGCAACVTTVTNVLNSIESVENFDISLYENNSGILSVLATENQNKSAAAAAAQCQSEDDDHNGVSIISLIRNKLDGAGFPVTPLLQDE